MKKLLIIPFLFAQIAYSQTEYLQNFGHNYNESIIDNQANNALIVTQNNDLVLASMYPFQDTTIHKYYSSIFIKTDLNGNVIFKKAFGDSLSFLPADIIETKDKGYLLTGHSHSRFYGSLVASSCVAIKTDSGGNVLWSRLVGGNETYGYKVAELNDSTYCGISTDTANQGDIFYYTVSKSGDFIDGETYGGAGTDSPHSIVCSNGFSYILSNTNNSFDTTYQIMMSKINPNGTVNWTKTYSFIGYGINASFLIKKSPNLFCISGGCGTNVYNGTFMLETDSMGNPINAKWFDIDTLDEVTSIATNNNNGYLLNILSTPNSQYGSFYSVILDNNLNITYKNRLNIKSFDGLGSMGPTILRKNNNIFTGGVLYDNSWSPSPFIIKLDSTGAYPCSDSGMPITTFTLNVISQSRTLSSTDKSLYRIIADTSYNIPILDSMACSNYTSIKNIYQSGNFINVYPNPTSDQFSIETNTTDKLSVDLYDINGRHVFSASVSGKENINVATLDNGIYSLTIKTADRVINKKLVIAR